MRVTTAHSCVTASCLLPPPYDLYRPRGVVSRPRHSKWTGNDLPCGAGAELSCRDLARGAQLWLNAGVWPGHGQLMDSRHALDGTKWVYPDQGDPYGYGVRLRPGDPVDPNVVGWGAPGAVVPTPAQCPVDSGSRGG